MRKEPTDSRISRLYTAMPGAPLPPIIDGFYAWGEIEGNDHWQFCEVIIEAIDYAVEAAKGGEK